MNTEWISFFYHLITGFFIALVLFWGLKWLLRRDGSSYTSVTPWCGIIKRPLMTIPWLLFVLYSIHTWPGVERYEWHETLPVFERILMIIYPAWLVWELSLRTEDILANADQRWAARLSHSVIARTIQLLVVLSLLLSLAQVLGYSLSALLAFGGIGGIIIGLAAKDWLSNFFGGLMLMLDRPFKEGDWVRSPDRAIEGHVEKVGWRLTKVRTFDRRPIYVPNSIFTGIVVENATRMRNRRMIENFTLRYEDLTKLPVILERLEKTMIQLEDVDAREPHYAVFIRYDDSSLLCQVRVHITQTGRVGFLKVQQSILLLIAQIVAEEGAEFAYPVRRIFSDGPIDS